MSKNERQSQSKVHEESLIPRPHPVLAQTALAYEERVHSIRQAADDCCPRADGRLFTVWELVEYFLSRPWRLSTFSSYRSALLWVMRKSQDQSAASVRAYESLQAAVKPPAGLVPPKKRRPKSISEHDCALLEAELLRRAKTSVWAERTRRLFMAGLATGLRPDEWWKGPCWSDSSPDELTVVCGKLTASPPAAKREGKSPPPNAPLIAGRPAIKTRKVPVDPADREVVDLHLAAVREQISIDGAVVGIRALASSYYHQCKQVLSRTCDALWGGRKRYPLLTARSQFSANTKAQYGRDVAARLMGHSGKDSPSASYYGTSSQAHARFKGHRQSEQVDTKSRQSHRPTGERS